MRLRSEQCPVDAHQSIRDSISESMAGIDRLGAAHLASLPTLGGIPTAVRNASIGPFEGVHGRWNRVVRGTLMTLCRALGRT